MLKANPNQPFSTWNTGNLCQSLCCGLNPLYPSIFRPRFLTLTTRLNFHLVSCPKPALFKKADIHFLRMNWNMENVCSGKPLSSAKNATLETLSTKSITCGNYEISGPTAVASVAYWPLWIHNGILTIVNSQWHTDHCECRCVWRARCSYDSREVSYGVKLEVAGAKVSLSTKCVAVMLVKQ